jgi:hypothetical protein
LSRSSAADAASTNAYSSIKTVVSDSSVDHSRLLFALQTKDDDDNDEDDDKEHQGTQDAPNNPPQVCRAFCLAG